jgi:hypothetical protein
MADWSTIRTALSGWVTSITGLTTYWARRPRPKHFGDTYAILDLTGHSSVGNDIVETEYDDTRPAGSQIRRYQSGQRQFTLGVQVRSFRTADDVDALHYTSLLRDSVVLPEKSHAVFNGAEVAFAKVLSETPFDIQLDNRDLSVSQIDLRFNATSLVEDTPTGWIETLEDFELYDPESPVPPLWTGDIEVG